MVPDWIRDVVFWTSLFFVGYYSGYYRLEKKFKKKLLLQTAKLQRKIRELQEKD